MMELDYVVGKLLDKLDELGIADDTIVQFSTDNGAEVFTWPEGGNTPFKGEKGTTWEGGFRVPALARWPGKFPAGKVINDITSHQDWLPTLLAAAGEPEVKEKLLTGHQAGDKSFKAHIVRTQVGRGSSICVATRMSVSPSSRRCTCDGWPTRCG